HTSQSPTTTPTSTNASTRIPKPTPPQKNKSNLQPNSQQTTTPHPHPHTFPTQRTSDLSAIDPSPAVRPYVLGGADRQSEAHTVRSEEHTSELQSRGHLVWRLLLVKKEDRRQSDRQKRYAEYNGSGVLVTDSVTVTLIPI